MNKQIKHVWSLSTDIILLEKLSTVFDKKKRVIYRQQHKLSLRKSSLPDVHVLAINFLVEFLELKIAQIKLLPQI